MIIHLAGATTCCRRAVVYVFANLSEIMALIQKMVLSYGVLGKVGETSEATACAQAVPMTAKRESLGKGRGTGDLQAGLGVHRISSHCRPKDCGCFSFLFL